MTRGQLLLAERRAVRRVHANLPNDAVRAQATLKQIRTRLRNMPPEPLTTCVVCGGQHGAGHACPWCACREAAAA